MLMDGPGGWPIEPNWWKREEKDFGDQLRWCEYCGMALDTYTRDAREEIDDVSPFWAEQLINIDSPKLRKNRINVIDIKNNIIQENSKANGIQFSDSSGNGPYTKDYDARFNKEKTVLFPLEFERFSLTAIQHVGSFKEYFKKILDESDPDNYLLIVSDNVKLNDEGLNNLKKCIINPGTLHFIDFSSDKKMNNAYFSNRSALKSGFAALFNKKALSLRNIDLENANDIHSFQDIARLWIPSKIVKFHPKMEYAAKPYCGSFIRPFKRNYYELWFWTALRIMIKNYIKQYKKIK
jgi:hypothetical protein